MAITSTMLSAPTLVAIPSATLVTTSAKYQLQHANIVAYHLPHKTKLNTNNICQLAKQEVIPSASVVIPSTAYDMAITSATAYMAIKSAKANLMPLETSGYKNIKKNTSQCP